MAHAIVAACLCNAYDHRERVQTLTETGGKGKKRELGRRGMGKNEGEKHKVQGDPTTGQGTAAVE